MVRFLKVTETEDRKKMLVARSQMYRDTLTLEVANARYSVALFKRRLKSGRNILLLLSSVFPLTGIFLARQQVKQAGGVLGKLMSGLRLFSQFAPLLKKFRSDKTESVPSRQNMTRFS
jgi:hypothetical protein